MKKRIFLSCFYAAIVFVIANAQSNTSEQWHGFGGLILLNFKDNPKENLEKLAANKVPLYFTFGLHDAMIPYEENAWVIAEKYIQLGGAVTIFPMTKGKQEQNGHHITIEQPESIADFIVNAWKNLN